MGLTLENKHLGSRMFWIGTVLPDECSTLARDTEHTVAFYAYRALGSERRRVCSTTFSVGENNIMRIWGYGKE
jgi:hypothetical protein